MTKQVLAKRLLVVEQSLAKSYSGQGLDLTQLSICELKLLRRLVSEDIDISSIGPTGIAALARLAGERVYR